MVIGEGRRLAMVVRGVRFDPVRLERLVGRGYASGNSG